MSKPQSTPTDQPDKTGREEAEEIRPRLERVAETDLPFAEDAQLALERLDTEG